MTMNAVLRGRTGDGIAIEVLNGSMVSRASMVARTGTTIITVTVNEERVRRGAAASMGLIGTGVGTGIGIGIGAAIGAGTETLTMAVLHKHQGLAGVPRKACCEHHGVKVGVATAIGEDKARVKDQAALLPHFRLRAQG